MKTRKTLLVATTIILTLSLSSLSISAEKAQLTGPYDSVRDYVKALEARGRLLRIKEVDQDKYEGTAFVYKMLDNLGIERSPAIMFEKVKINGKWMKGPVLGNIYCGWDTAAMAYGVEKITDDQGEMFLAVVDRIASLADKKTVTWKKIEPVKIDKSKAPCKEVIIKGDEVDLYKFPWFKNNPGDAAQYVNTGAVIMVDPELGRNVGTYRCQVKGKNKIGVNPEYRQHGWEFMKRAMERGERVMQAAVVLGVDPITWSMSSSKLAGLGEDELALAGGFRDKPVEVVKCETSDLYVPAHAEIVIEGEMPMATEEEGPYGEMFGYMGRQHKNFYMNVKAITHRKNPWVINSFTGITKPTHMIPWQVSSFLKLKKMLPNLVALYSPREAIGFSILSINKRLPGEGMAAGQLAAAARFLGTAKIVIVVDKDIDATNISQVLHAMATRWQPHPASLIIPQTWSIPLDPSSPKMFLTSKIVIDATQQLPAEGGPQSWQPVSRVLLEEKAPESFGIVEKKWAEYWKDWKK
jgi:4-hydroxy-3-polyprenylbenzoate decarboxylase